MGGWDWVVLLAVATSAIASTQTTIIPASRTGLSMARRHALPARFGHIHPRFRTPDVSTWWVAVIAIVWYLVLYQISENALFDSLTALSLLIAFYYALTGVACAIYYRRQLTESAQNFLLIGVGPVVGAVLLIWLLVQSVRDIADPANSYTGSPGSASARRWSSGSASPSRAWCSWWCGGRRTGSGGSGRASPTRTSCTASRTQEGRDHDGLRGETTNGSRARVRRVPGRGRALRVAIDVAARSPSRW